MSQHLVITPGTIVRTGVGVPDDNLGEDDDLYTDRATGITYWRNGGSYEALPGTGGGGPGSGDLNYVHTQTTPAPNWNVVHGLGKYPSITVVDSGNNVVLPDEHYVDANTVNLAFTSATSGKAYVN